MKVLLKTKNYLLVFGFLLFQSLFAQTSRKHNWEEDLKIYKESLEQKHIDLYHTVSKEDFFSEWQEIYNKIDSLNDFEITVALMKLTRSINDGHTAISLRNTSTHNYPFEVRYIDNQWRVVKIDQEYKNLLNASLIAIDDVPIESVIAKVSEVAQYVENEYSKNRRTGTYLRISELLHTLHISKKKHEAIFTFVDTNTNKITTKLTVLDNTNSNESSNSVTVNLGIPEITKPSIPKFPYIWFSPIKNTQALYIYFESYPTFENMQAFGETLVSHISKHQTKQLVIDMRNNGGGDLYVGVVLAYALNLADSIDWKNGVYVLTSNITFSAGTSNAALFKQLLNATIVGEPTGSNPSGYQDMDTFTLPNSKVVVTYSKRLFRLSNKLHTALQPDVIIHQKIEDFLTNTDTVLKELIKRF